MNRYKYLFHIEEIAVQFDRENDYFDFYVEANDIPTCLRSALHDIHADGYKTMTTARIIRLFNKGTSEIVCIQPNSYDVVKITRIR